MAPGRPDLLLDEIEIVEEPLGGWSDAKLAFPIARDKAVGIEENALVLTELREQKVRPPLLINDVLRRELPRVPLELLEAEQLGAQRLIIAAARGLDPVPAASPQTARMALRKLLLPVFKPIRPLYPWRTPDCIMAQVQPAARRSGPPLLLFGVWKARLGSPFRIKMELDRWIWADGQPHLRDEARVSVHGDVSVTCLRLRYHNAWWFRSRSLSYEAPVRVSVGVVGNWTHGAAIGGRSRIDLKFRLWA